MKEISGKRLGAAIKAALRDEDWAGALEHLATWCARYPSHAAGWLWRAECLAHLDRLEEALEAASRASALAPDDERTAHQLERLETRLPRNRQPDRAPGAPVPPAEWAAGPDAPDNGRDAAARPPAKPRPADPDGVLWRTGAVIEARYEVEGVARGGMGEVYFVYDHELGVKIAVKTPLPSTLATPSGRARFLREAEAWISLGLHPNICSAYYLRSVGGVPRLFIEHVDGGSLAEWLREGRSAPVEVRLDLAIQIAAGMHHAHTFEWRDEEGTAHRGVVHRDLKPANVLLDSDGVARVTDFGLVGRGAGDAQPDVQADGIADDVGGMSPPEDGVWGTVTMGGVVMGTPPYMPPEQWRGAHRAGRPADVYAFGCILYELLCGRRPFTLDRRFRVARPEVVKAEWERLHREEQPPDPGALNSRVDPELAGVINACLAKAPEQRPVGFDHLATSLKEAYSRVAGVTFPRPEPRAARLVADALNNRGVSFATLGQEARAERAWREGLEADPHHIEAIYNLCLFEWRRQGGSDAGATQRMEEVCRTNASGWREKLLAGRVHLCLGRFSRAVELFRAAAEAAGDHAPGVARSYALALCARASETGEEELWREAASISARAGAGGRNDPGVLTTYAHASARLGEHDRADRLYAEARRLRQDLPEELQRGAERLVPGTHLVGRLTAFVGRALAASVSSDGTVGVTRVEDGILTVWDLTSGDLLRTVRPEGRRPRCHALDPAGEYAYTVAEGDPVCQWSLRTGGLERRLHPHTGFVNALAVSPDGRRIAGVGSTGAMIVWELGGEPPVRVLEAHQGFGTCVAWGGGSRTVVSGSSEGTVRVLDVEGGGDVVVLSGHRDAVTSIAVDRGARRALSGGANGSVRLWDVEREVCLCTFEGHTGPVTWVELRDDGGWCLTGSADGSLRLWQLDDGEPRIAMVVEGGVTGGAATPEWDSVLVSHGTLVSHLRFREIPELRLPWVVSSPVSVAEAEQRAEGFHRHLEAARLRLEQGDHAAAAAAVAEARSTSGYERASEALELVGEIAAPFPRGALAAGWEERTLRGHSDRVTAAALSPAGNMVVSAGADRKLILWDPRHGRIVRSFADDLLELSVVFTRGGERVLSAGLDNVIHVWDAEQGGCLRVLEGHEAKVFALAVGPPGRRLVSASADESVRTWDLGSGRCTAVMEGHGCQVLCAAVSPDERCAVTGGVDGSLLAWDLERAHTLVALPGHSGPVHDVAWSGDGRHVLSGGRDGTVRFWDVTAGTCLRTIDGTRAVTAVAVSPDGEVALAGGEDATLRLWDIRQRLCLRAFAGHDGAITALRFAPDGRRFLTASADATLRVWYLDWTPAIQPFVDWDDRVRPYLEVFLSRRASDGVTGWSEKDWQGLVADLRRRGMGYIRPEGVRRRLEQLATSVPQASERPAVEMKRPPPSPRRQRSGPSRRLWFIIGGAVLIPLLLLLLHTRSRARLDFNDRVMAGSRRRVIQTLVPTLPQVAREARCDPAHLRSYVRDIIEYSDDEWDRMTAMHCLEVLSDERTVRPLLSMVRPRASPDWRGGGRRTRDRSAAPEVLSVLARMDDGTCLAIADAMGDRDPVVRRVAANALAYRGSEASVEILVVRAEHPDPRVRSAVAGVLREIVSSGRLDRWEAFEVFETLASDEEPRVRERVADALDVFLGSLARELLVRLAKDPDPEVRKAAWETVQTMRVMH